MPERDLKPGSDAALNAGCTCPVLDNGHGRGFRGMPDVFVMNEDCPLHGEIVQRAATKKEQP